VNPEPNATSQLLFAVVNTFDIKGRGLVIASGPNTHLALLTSFRNGAQVSLKRPDGSVIEHAAHLELYTPNKRKILALSLPGLTEADVPKGTEVWTGPPGTVSPGNSLPSFSGAIPRVSKSLPELVGVKYSALVLIAEPESDLKERVKKMLRSSSVQACSSGLAALRKLGRADVDLVIVDIMLPDISRSDFIQRYRNSGGMAPVVVVINAKKATIDAGPNKEAGKTEPFDLDDLAAKVSGFLRK
jgi:CheY-like chemotaxis protein